MSTQTLTAAPTRTAHPVAAPAVDRAAANATAVRSIYAAFATGDVPAILGKLSEDVEWEFGYPHNDDIPWLKSGRGRDQVGRFFRSIAGFRFDRFDVLAILPGDEWVVGLIALDITWTATGGRIIEPCEPQVWRFDESGLVSSIRHAVDTRQHARAAGLG